mmetsp:Transcript_434/g.1013  ORF Transcript_434/g.1013 Transcript_434/m.1013 type:complete len:228 (-) Transcript_434:185-868(-)
MFLAEVLRPSNSTPHPNHCALLTSSAEAVMILTMPSLCVNVTITLPLLLHSPYRIPTRYKVRVVVIYHVSPVTRAKVMRRSPRLAECRKIASQPLQPWMLRPMRQVISTTNHRRDLKQPTKSATMGRLIILRTPKVLRRRWLLRVSARARLRPPPAVLDLMIMMVARKNGLPLPIQLIIIVVRTSCQPNAPLRNSPLRLGRTWRPSSRSRKSLPRVLRSKPRSPPHN